MFIPIIPIAPLNQYIECFWYLDMPLPYQRERILPTGKIELIFNFGTPYKVLDPHTLLPISHSKHHWIAGFQTESFVIRATGNRSHMLGIRFRPGGAYPFFPFPISELNDQVITMDLLWGRLADELFERLLEIKGVPGRVHLLQTLLCQKLRHNLHGLDIVQHLAHHIAHLNGLVNIKALSQDIGLSQKHLTYQFKRMIGVSPKKLSRIYKFQHVLETIDPSRPVNWTNIAHHCHYYDQAHFNKDFQAFSGLNPTQYLRLRAHHLGHDLTQGQAPHFVPIG